MKKNLMGAPLPSFSDKKDGGKAGTPQSHRSLGVGARTKRRALCLSPVLCYVPVGEA